MSKTKPTNQYFPISQLPITSTSIPIQRLTIFNTPFLILPIYNRPIFFHSQLQVPSQSSITQFNYFLYYKSTNLHVRSPESFAIHVSPLLFPFFSFSCCRCLLLLGPTSDVHSSGGTSLIPDFESDCGTCDSSFGVVVFMFTNCSRISAPAFQLLPCDHSGTV